MGIYGKMVLSYPGGPDMDMGIVTKVGCTYSKSVSTTPLVSMPMDDTFAMETGASESYTFSFQRKHPGGISEDRSDTETMCNAAWYDLMTEIVDRWQMKTDGFRLRFTPLGNDNVESVDINGYVRSLTRDYRAGDNEVIHGNLVFERGTMFVNASRPLADSIPASEFQISMSDSANTAWYSLMDSTGTDCVSSYTMYGGMETPFEYIVMRIPQAKLNKVAPALVDDIQAGRNRVMVNAVGRSNMTVTSCGASGDDLEVVAYCDAEVLRGYNLRENQTMDAFSWIRYILTQGRYGVAFRENVSFKYHVNPKEGAEHQLSFNAGTNVWTVLQICAIYLRAKLFFTGNMAYLTDFTADTPRYDTGDAIDRRARVEVHPKGDRGNPMYARAIGQVKLGPEGKYPVTNSLTLNCSEPTEDGMRTRDFIYTDEDSIAEFESLTQASYSVPQLVVGEGVDQGKEFAQGVFAYRREVQQSVTVKLKEMYSTGSGIIWSPFFHPYTALSAISSSTDGFEVNNISDITGEPCYPLLLLSGFERSYPQGATAYTFGVIGNVDLSSSTSRILSTK